MSETIGQPPHIPMRDILIAAGRGELDALPLPDVHASPYDTSFMSPEDGTTMPVGVRDVRAAYTEEFDGWDEGSKVRGTVAVSIDPLGKVVQAAAKMVNPRAQRHGPTNHDVYAG